MGTSKMTTATYQGRRYVIPDIWLAGFCSRGYTVLDAVAQWAYQQELAEMVPLASEAMAPRGDDGEIEGVLM